MAKKKSLGRLRGARTATKKQERELIERAKKMRKDPKVVLPDLEECGGDCFMCPFVRALARMRRIQDISDDEKKLTKMAQGGDEISRAYAATLILALAGKVPYFARAFTPYGEAFFAVRGKCKKEKLIGIQHYDNPSLRLVGVLDLVRGKKLHIYSLKDRMVCTAKTAEPPDEFVEYMLGYLKVPLEGKGEVRHCHHISEKDLTGPSRPLIKLEWFSGAKTIAFCQRCAKSSGNTFARFLERMAIPKPKEDFDLKVLGSLECEANCEDCKLDIDTIDPGLEEDYFSGQIGDLDLIRKHLNGIRDSIRDQGERLFVIGNKCYGSDRKAFMKALRPSPEERTAIKLILKKADGPIIVEGDTGAKLIQQYWKKYGKTILYKLMGDKELATKTFKSSDLNRKTVTQILKDAIVFVRKRDIISKLPRYKKLPAVAKFADKVARVYKSSGAADAARTLERTLPDDTRVKAVAYALLKAMGHEASKGWVFVETEKDFAEFLEESANELLEASPDEYHEALQNLLAKTGSTEKIKRLD
jgi:hypothetical protein